MANQQIIDYIEKTRKAGYTEAQIKDALKKAGWSDANIDEAIGAKEQIAVPLPLPNPPEKVVASEKATKNKNEKTNVLAIIALITSFFIPFIPLILAIISLVQINKRKEKGLVLAIIAIVMSLTFGLFFSMMLTASMAYFGVLDPEKLLPERCQFQVGMDCIDRAAITSSEITFALRNSIGFPVSIESVESEKCKGLPQIAVGDSTVFTNLNNNQVKNNEVFRIKLTGCNNGKTGQEVQDAVEIMYMNEESSLSNPAMGQIRGRVN